MENEEEIIITRDMIEKYVFQLSDTGRCQLLLWLLNSCYVESDSEIKDKPIKDFLDAQDYVANMIIEWNKMYRFN